MQGGGFGGGNVQQEFEQKMMMTLVQGAVNDCFENCVTSFKEPSLSQSEMTCLKNCGSRFIGTQQAFGDIQ